MKSKTNRKMSLWLDIRVWNIIRLRELETESKYQGTLASVPSCSNLIAKLQDKIFQFLLFFMSDLNLVKTIFRA